MYSWLSRVFTGKSENLSVVTGGFAYEDGGLESYDPGQYLTITKGGWEELRSRTLSVVSNANPGALNPTVTSTQALGKYRSWVYPCVNLIQRKFSVVPYYLYKEVGEPNDEEFDRILDHPATRLLKNPNKFMTGRFFRQITQMFLDLCGCAFWLIVRDGLGRPAELHILNPHELINIEIGNTTDNLISKFVFAPTYQRAIRKEYSYEDVVYFHYPHPFNPVIPFTPIQALAHVTDIDIYLQVYEKDFFQNNARPDFVIVAEQPMSPEQADRVQEGWFAKHRGAGKQHRPAILSRNVRIEQLGMSARDFEFLALSEWTKDNILAAYQVPEAMLGLYESFNKASSITAETTFVKNSLDPRLKLFEDVINMQLLPQFQNTTGLEFRHESALPKDDEWELAKNQTELSIGLVTINEIRKKRGQKPFDSELCNVPWMNGQPIRGINKEADKIWDEGMMAASGGMGMGMAPQPGMEGMAPQGMLPAGNMPSMQGAFGAMGGRPPDMDMKPFLQDALRAAAPSLSTLLNAARGSRGGLMALLQSDPQLHSFGEMIDRERKDQAFTKFLTKGIYDYIEEIIDESDRLVYKAYEDMIIPVMSIEEEYKEAAERFLVEKGVEVHELITKNVSEYVTKEPMEDISIEDLKNSYIESARPYITKAARLGFKYGVKVVVKGTGGTGYTEGEEAAYDAAGRFLNMSAELRANSIKRNLSQIVRTGLKKGMGIDRVADLIKEKFAQIGTQRAAMIARTELSGAADAGADASFEAINKKAGKIVVKQAVLWSALDERVCKDPDPEKNCYRNHGSVLKDYETGKVYRDTAVLHPNCRCVRRPVFAE